MFDSKTNKFAAIQVTKELLGVNKMPNFVIPPWYFSATLDDNH